MGLDNKRTAIAVLLFFATLILYLSSICPNMYWRDAAEFQAVAFQLGIAHPAGSPLYALVAKVFTFLPFGSIAFKVNLVSAFFGALLIVATFLLIIECLQLLALLNLSHQVCYLLFSQVHQRLFYVYQMD